MKHCALVIYHGPHCNDGMTAAWVTHNALVTKGIEPTLYSMNYGDDQQEALLDYLEQYGSEYFCQIYIVDFSLPVEVLTELRLQFPNAAITVLDHHKSAFYLYGWEGELEVDSHLYTYVCEDSVSIHLENDHSGAGICWKYFHPNTPAPYLVRYVQDRDLWHYYFPETKSIHMFLGTREKTIEDWDIVHAALESKEAHSAVVKLGALILTEYNELITAIASKATPCTIKGQSGLMVECEGKYASDVGHALCDASGTYGLTYYESADAESMICSLRSIGDYDVEVLAKSFGGGGHKHAAGFKVSLESVMQRVFEDTRKELDFS